MKKQIDVYKDLYSIHFSIEKSYFFILPSIQIITSKVHPFSVSSKDIFKWGIDVDCLCFHLSMSFRKKGDKNGKK